MRKLIRVVQGGKRVRGITFSALVGDFFYRIEKSHGTVEISDPELEEKLTESELAELYKRFPEINPNRPLPPKPSEEKIEFRQEAIQEEKEIEEVSVESLIESYSTKELFDWLKVNEYDVDGRKKKNREYLIEQITTK
jgi:hypothetical protein